MPVAASPSGYAAMHMNPILKLPFRSPILLAHIVNGAAMTRAQGLVRLIVPSEIDDALRQVKWVVRVELHAYQR